MEVTWREACSWWSAVKEELTDGVRVERDGREGERAGGVEEEEEEQGSLAVGWRGGRAGSSVSAGGSS
jgi:hypothetical protein